MNSALHGLIILSRPSGLTLQVSGFVLESGTWAAIWAVQMPLLSFPPARC